LELSVGKLVHLALSKVTGMTTSDGVRIVVSAGVRREEGGDPREKVIEGGSSWLADTGSGRG